MEEPYWIIADTIIFKPEFNYSLNKYVEIISQYKKIIFSNYDEPEIAIKKNNINYYYKYNNIMNKSLFNQPLSDLLSKLINLEQLNFGITFNQPLLDSLLNLINLKQLPIVNCCKFIKFDNESNNG